MSAEEPSQDRTAETNQVPKPMKESVGATDSGPRNLARDRQNPDMLAPPDTDSGEVPNLKFSFSDTHNRLEEGGWAREVTARELPIATTLAGVNMHLTPGGVRELHWHKEAEWAFVLDGRVRITAVDENGWNSVDDLGVGDLWYFPSGIPHSLQGLEECEFLLVFDDGHFSENSTFSLTDWFAHTP
jgi:oxalate decarboxylase